MTSHMQTSQIQQEPNSLKNSDIHCTAENFEKSFIPQDNFNILQLNVRGINKVDKFNELMLLFDSLDVKLDVIVLSETKLKENFPVQLYSIPGFNRFSCHRKNGEGGGVMVFVRKSLKAELVELQQSSFEQVSINLRVSSSDYRLLAVYRAPDHHNFNDFITEIERFISESDKKSIIVGDVNISIPNLSARTNLLDRNSELYLDLLESFNFTVANLHPTRPLSGKTIDHFVANFCNKTRITNVTCELDWNSFDHNFVLTSIHRSKNPRQVELVTKSKLTHEKLMTNFPSTPEDYMGLTNTDEVAEKFTSDLQTAINRSTKTYIFKVKHSERICSWRTLKTLELTKKKDKILRKLRKKPTNQKYRNDLRQVSFALTSSIRSDFRNHVYKKLAARDPKKLWRGLNEITGRKSKEPVSSIIEPTEGYETSKCKEIASIFNSFFSRGCSSTANGTRNQSVERQPDNSMVLLPPDEEEVFSEIKLLRDNSAPGHDEVSVKTLKSLISIATPVLTHLIKIIFESGIYPKVFKLAVAAPIHKNGSKILVENYRLVSMLTVPSKVVEGIMFKRLSDYFVKHQNLLFERQYGFRDKSNTETAALELSRTILKARDNNQCASGVFMDLRKAFDMVNHVNLVQVLEKYGVRGKALAPLKSYLDNRRQIVKIGKEMSHEETISSGVVQGSRLGPLLFLIFLNAIGYLPIKGKIFLFADDAVLINVHNRKDNDIEDTIRSDMTTIMNFLQQRGLHLNAAKTNFMIFSPGKTCSTTSRTIEISESVEISRVASTKYLGLILNEKLNWKDHLEKMKSKLAPASGILWKMKDLMPTHAKKLVFDSLFGSHLNYMAPVWGFSPGSHISDIQVLQNRALRNVFNLPFLTNRVEMYSHLVGKQLPVRGNALLKTAITVHKLINGHAFSNLKFTLASEVHRKNLRNKSSLRPALQHSTFGTRSLETIGPRIYNKIPNEIKSKKSASAFKQSLSRHLHSEEFITSCFNNQFFDILI
jgi:hypothetical protein